MTSVLTLVTPRSEDKSGMSSGVLLNAILGNKVEESDGADAGGQPVVTARHSQHLIR